MAIEQDIARELQKLPLEKRLEVLDFVEFLGQKRHRRRSARSLKGLWADLASDTTDCDISEARSEMWGRFPKVDP